MALVYAEMDKLEEFSEMLNSFKSRMIEEAQKCDETISRTINALSSSVDDADSCLKKAENAHRDAGDRLADEQRRVERHNANLDEGQQPEEVSQYYYDRVNTAAEREDAARESRNYIVNCRDSFENYSASHKAKQNALCIEYSDWVKRSTVFFDQYISILEKAKEAIFERTFAYSGERASDASDSDTVGAPLSDSDVKKIAAATGWSEKTIKTKCTVCGGLYRYKTNNEKMEGKISPQGVYFSRSQIELGGLTFEGVFPEFDSLMDVTSLPESMWHKRDYLKHFTYCNSQLKDRILADPVFAGNFSPLQMQQIVNGVTPSGFTWHHHQVPGMLQLVRKQQHNSAFGGANHTGGNSLWCKEDTI